MKIYTGVGDRGKTSLFSGERVTKADLRVEAYGDVDELNSTLGVLVATLAEGQEELRVELQRIQAELFQVGSWLATTPDSLAAEALEPIIPEHGRALEAAIDRMEEDLPRLTGFILPGGHISAAWTHVARTVCRRAERRVVRLSDAGEESPSGAGLEDILVYLNRLSDYLFVLARYCNQLAGVEEALWKKDVHN